MKKNILVILAAAAALALGAASPAPAAPDAETAVFCGGCFWCMQPPFDKLPGVVSTTAGYTGGSTKKPTYAEVSAGGTGHCEAVQVVFDPSRVSYAGILDVFWRNIDPTNAKGQFVDLGRQYRSAIFYSSAAQKRQALASKERLGASGPFEGKPIATEILPAAKFWPAEEYHQKYYLKNPFQYNFYRIGSGRDAFLKQTWEKGSAPERK